MNEDVLMKPVTLYTNINIDLETLYRGWRDGSVVKSPDFSSKGSEFKSQKLHGG